MRATLICYYNLLLAALLAVRNFNSKNSFLGINSVLGAALLGICLYILHLIVPKNHLISKKNSV